MTNHLISVVVVTLIMIDTWDGVVTTTILEPLCFLFTKVLHVIPLGLLWEIEILNESVPKGFRFDDHRSHDVQRHQTCTVSPRSVRHLVRELGP